MKSNTITRSRASRRNKSKSKNRTTNLVIKGVIGAAVAIYGIYLLVQGVLLVQRMF